ncbi:hypothetical protein ACFO6R_02905 [Eubacterium multiforme]|uniref:DUF3806 domain-containing protein n=1 Tax=Eubacterium multiforme TaxID=83339 RepID=A0ABT9URJ5_9FIRM|nr:hypothetical protein [Eubacterium multiforme]MDQ0148294.1 hypothetical protein [Eubacterium multiforme]
MERLERIFKEASLRAVIFSKNNLGIKLDFSEESLNFLDDILEVFHKEIEMDTIDNDKVIDLSMAFGGYLGEVISKNIGGVWEENNGKTIFLEVYDNKVLPLNIVYKRINIGERASVKRWYTKFKEKVCYI